MKNISDFLALWTTANCPQHIEHRTFDAAGFTTHSAGFLVISPEGLPPEVLAGLPADKSVLVGVSWTDVGPAVAVGYPGIYASGQAVFTVAHLTKEGGIKELFHTGVSREKSRAAV